MTVIRRSCWLCAGDSVATGRAQTPQAQPPAPPPDSPGAGAGDAQPPPTEADASRPTYKETVVVSASKTEQQLVNAPATMTVIGAEAAGGGAVDQLRATCCAACRA